MAEKKIKEKETAESVDFESAVKEIDEISARLEDSALTLDESLALYEKGIVLVRACRKMLEEAEAKISSLYPDENGEMAEKPFSAEEEQNA